MCVVGIAMFLGVSKNDRGKLCAKFGRRWCRCCPWAPQPGPVGQVGRLSETAIAFAGAGRASTETAVAFAGAGRASTETAIAFAGAGRASTETAIAFAGAGRASTETVIAFAGGKWVFLACFSAALVLSVSMVAVQGRALVMPVSRWSASAARSGAVGFNVATLSRLVREKVRPARPDVCVSAKKFAQRTKNGPQSASCGAPGEVFRENTAGGAVLGEYFRDPAAEGSHGASCVVPRPWPPALYWQC